ncbi:MAG: PQQ-dependent dehydrogenase, methanol/ethanol family, partial [Sphingomonadales bacterium]
MKLALRRSPFWLLVGVVLALGGCGPQSQQQARKWAAVDDARLAAADADVDNWMSNGRTWDEQRYSPVDQINSGNVQNLSLAWAVELDTKRGQEATPIVVDGVMYVSTAWSKVMALDAATGRVLWKFDPKNIGAKGAHACCDVVNRGVAVWKGRVFVGTIDGRLIALDAATGKPVWSVVTVDQSQPYTITMAPRVVRDKVLIGNSGAELGIRGYVSAYDTATGKLVWRFYTVPGNPAKGPDGAASDPALQRIALPTWHGKWWSLGGGGPVWDALVYDRELNQLIFGVGNGTPWNQKYLSEGKGDNLFLSSIVAVDPDTGAYKWHYQVTPGDTWDFDATQQLTLATLNLPGGPRKVVMQASKNGFFYLVDRQTGKLISAPQYATQTWAERIDLKTGRPIEKANARFQEGPAFNLPSGIGAHAWQPMSYNPKTGLVYIPTMQYGLTYSDTKPFEVHPGRWNTGVTFVGPDETPKGKAPSDTKDAALRELKGALVAWDPVAQKARWRVERDWPWNGGTLTTGGNLVFEGTVHGQLEAYSADTGHKLWSFQSYRGIMAGPMTYRVNGEQYVAVLGGYGGSMGMASASPFEKRKMPYGILIAFKLNGKGKLPPYRPEPLGPAQPTAEHFTAGQLATGQKYFYQFCSICHNGPVNPDLRRSALLQDAATWRAVVIDGALEKNGMASFRQYLTPAQAEGIRAFVNSLAKQLQEEEGGS